MKSLHVGGGYRHDPQSMRKMKDNILEFGFEKVSVPGSLSPLSTSAKLTDHVNIYYTTVQSSILRYFPESLNLHNI
jgi:hypothetical protein